MMYVGGFSMMYVSECGKKYSVGDTIHANGIKYQIMDFKMDGTVLVRYLNEHDAWVFRVLSPDTLGLRRVY